MENDSSSGAPDFVHRVFYYTGRDPDWSDLEATEQNRQRILMVIRARWAALGLLAFYGLFLRAVFYARADASVPLGQEIMAAGALVFVVVYNSWFHLTHEWWARVRIANNIQLLLDLLVITYLVHFSGGVHSWFWAVYVLITLEAAFLLERKREVWAIGACGAVLYGGLLTAEYLDVIAPIPMPFEDTGLQHDFTYEVMTFGWVSVLNAAVAVVGTYLMGIVRDRQRELEELGVRDGLTGLYNRRYFFHRLRGEIERCRRYERRCSLLMIDVDNFKDFNDRHGHLEGDYALKSLSKLLGASIRRSDQPPTYEVDIACRYGGEEFAIILPETEAGGGRAAAERLREEVITQAALTTAERIRSRVAEADIRGRSITVSIGVSTFPTNGDSADAVVRSADEALYAAKGRGRNRVVLASGDWKPPDSFEVETDERDAV